MVDSYLADLHAIPVTNVFQVERLVDPRWRIEWTHLTAQMTYLLRFDQVRDLDLSQLEGRSCVLLAREPLSTLASAYYQARYRLQIFSGTPSEFVRSPLFGMRKLVAFYDLMVDLRDRCGFFTVITYEDLRHDAAAGLRAVLRGLGAEIDADRVEKAVAAGSFENLKRLARTPEYANTLLSPSDPDNPDSDKVRRGDPNAWRELFTNEDLRYMVEVTPNSDRYASLFQSRSAS